MNKIILSVGIPAYNEEANIKNLLKSILAQKQEDFELKEVIVVSDGSDDNTEKEVMSVADSKIKLFAESERKGKVVRVNEIFAKFSGDVLVQFDADVVLKGENVLSNLAKPFSVEPSADLACGFHEALKPQTFVEKLAKFGDDVWEQAKRDLGDKAEGYRCLGQIRAFSRRFLQEFRTLPEAGTVEDVYSFYFAKAKGYRVVWVPEAVVYFRLVSNIKDYIKQIGRFFGARVSMSGFFGAEMAAKYETMTEKAKLKALFKIACKTPPHIVFCYLILQSITRLSTKFTKKKPVWDVSTSSKQLIK